MIRLVLSIADHLLALFLGLFLALELVVLRIAWWFSDRRDDSARRIVLVLSGSGIASIANRGTDHLETFDNPHVERTIFLWPGAPRTARRRVGKRLWMVDVARPRAAARLRAAGFRVSAFAVDQLAFFQLLPHLARRRGARIVRCMDPGIVGIYGTWLRALLGIPLIQNINANMELIYRTTGITYLAWNAKNRWVRKVSHFFSEAMVAHIVRRAELVFGGNRNNLEYAFFRGADPHRTVVVRANISKAHFLAPEQRADLRAELGPPGAKLLLYMGRFSAEKHVADVLHALVAVRRRFPEARLIMVGDGPDAAGLKQLALDLEIADHVAFPGYLPNARTMLIAASVDVHICPYSGAVLIEAALAAKPIVAYDVEWHSELIVPEMTGLLADFGDPESLARGVIRHLENPAAAAAMGLNARKVALSYFSHDAIRDREGKFYRLLLAKQGL